MEETISTETLTSPSPLPILPFDVVADILCRLPVKLLLQLQCMCKSWKSLISDPTFTKKHLCKSTPIHHLMTSLINISDDVFHYDSPIHYVFSTSKITKTPFNFPKTIKNRYDNPSGICSCHGILCFLGDGGSFVLWNPSTRKFKILPCLPSGFCTPLFSFGYDNFSNKYKIVAIFFNEVSVYTLGGTHSWRRVQDFPSCHGSDRPGIFVSGSFNWLACDTVMGYYIASLDLEKETFQKLLHPDLKMNGYDNVRSIGVLKDCLCTCVNSISDKSLEFWVLNEFENKESWTKLYTIPYFGDAGVCAVTKILYNFADDKLLIYFLDSANGRDNKIKLGVYDFKVGALKILKIQNISCWWDSEVYVESLISPCS